MSLNRQVFFASFRLVLHVLFKDTPNTQVLSALNITSKNRGFIYSSKKENTSSSIYSIFCKPCSMRKKKNEARNTKFDFIHLNFHSPIGLKLAWILLATATTALQKLWGYYRLVVTNALFLLENLHASQILAHFHTHTHTDCCWATCPGDISAFPAAGYLSQYQWIDGLLLHPAWAQGWICRW